MMFESLAMIGRGCWFCVCWLRFACVLMSVASKPITFRSNLLSGNFTVVSRNLMVVSRDLMVGLRSIVFFQFLFKHKQSRAIVDISYHCFLRSLRFPPHTQELQFVKDLFACISLEFAVLWGVRRRDTCPNEEIALGNCRVETFGLIW